MAAKWKYSQNPFFILTLCFKKAFLHSCLIFKIVKLTKTLLAITSIYLQFKMYFSFQISASFANRLENMKVMAKSVKFSKNQACSKEYWKKFQPNRIQNRQNIRRHLEFRSDIEFVKMTTLRKMFYCLIYLNIAFSTHDKQNGLSGPTRPGYNLWRRSRLNQLY